MPTKYEILQDAMEKFAIARKRYETDCREFIIEISKQLASYLECPNQKISWVDYSQEFLETEEEENNNFFEASPDRRMILYSDSFYVSTFFLKLSPPKVLNPYGVYLHFRVKKTKDSFILKFADDGKEFQIQEGNQDDLEKVLDYVFKWMEELLLTDIVKYIQGKRKTMGFLANE